MAHKIPWTPQEEALLAALYPSQGTKCAGQFKDRSSTAVSLKARQMGLNFTGEPPRFTVAPIPTANRTFEELLADRAAEYERQKAHAEAKRAIKITLPDDGPFALVNIGDPHFDDPGTDIEQMLWVCERLRHEPHAYPLCVGDLTNNWVGRLAQLYGKQTLTDDEAAALMEGFLSRYTWLFVILGNHDKWGPVAAHQCKEYGVPYASHGARLEIEPARYVVDIRHDHPGRSQYAPEFAQRKQAYRGSDADLIIGGHTHVSAGAKCANGVAGRQYDCVRVGAFKRYDEYADANGFPDDNVGPYVLLVIDPSRQGPGRAVQHWDLERGLDELALLRERYESRREG